MGHRNDSSPIREDAKLAPLCFQVIMLRHYTPLRHQQLLRSWKFPKYIYFQTLVRSFAYRVVVMPYEAGPPAERGREASRGRRR